MLLFRSKELFVNPNLVLILSETKKVFYLNHIFSCRITKKVDLNNVSIQLKLEIFSLTVEYPHFDFGLT